MGDDNGPLIVGVTWFLTFFSLGFLSLRVYAKLSRRQGLWWDDGILIVSWILLFVEAITTQVGQQMGFGKRTSLIPPENIATMLLGTNAASSISSIAATLSKISFGVTLLRLTSGRVRLFVWFCIITLALAVIPSALFPWIRCTPVSKTWNPDPNGPGTCWPDYIVINYGIFNAAWCAAVDFVLALLPWYLIWNLQLKRREKLGVGLAMSIGVLSGVCAIVKGVYVIQLREQDFSYNGKDVTIWTAVETSTAIVAASIPVLRVFFKEKVSSYNNSRSHGQTTRKTIPLSRLGRSERSNNETIVEADGKRGGWTSIEDVEDGQSQRGILGETTSGERTRRGSPTGILAVNTVTVTVDVEKGAQNQRSHWNDLEK